ncbi:hypothetical protein ABPG77_001006 [Micractinium sp. CCAP 211/92]
MRPSRGPSNGKMGPASRMLRPSNGAVALSLALSAFALFCSQISSRSSVESVELVMTGGAERDLMAMQQPKLEVSAEKQAASAAAAVTASTTAVTGSGVSATARPQIPLGMGGQAWVGQQPRADGPRIAFIVTTSDSLQQIRVWINYHRSIGVSTFYIFADGQAARPDNVAALRATPGVTVVLRDAELRKRHENSRIWKESWLSAFFHKPCNHELFVLQSLNMEVGIEMAQRDGIDWLLHVDTDELIYPSGSPAFSLQEVLGSVPHDVDTLVFPNYESLPEREDVTDPFLEVSLFKKNYAHVVSDLYFKSYGAVARGNPNYFITYGNGKSAARVQQGMRPNGAHRWHSYVKTPKEWSSDQAAVLHYTYNRFSDLKSRRDRCDCAPTEEDAKRCFILPFDRMAFLEASLKNDKELMDWFKQRLVWDDPAVVNDLLKKGLFMRIYEPQLMIRGFMEAEKAGAEAAARSKKALEEATAAAKAAALQEAAAAANATAQAAAAAQAQAAQQAAAQAAQAQAAQQQAAQAAAQAQEAQQQQVAQAAQAHAAQQQQAVAEQAASAVAVHLQATQQQQQQQQSATTVAAAQGQQVDAAQAQQAAAQQQAAAVLQQQQAASQADAAAQQQVAAQAQQAAAAQQQQQAAAAAAQAQAAVQAQIAAQAHAAGTAVGKGSSGTSGEQAAVQAAGSGGAGVIAAGVAQQ